MSLPEGYVLESPSKLPEGYVMEEPKTSITTPPDFTNVANRLERPPDPTLMQKIGEGIRQGARESLPLVTMAGGEMVNPLGGGILGYGVGVELKNLLNRMTVEPSIMTPPTPILSLGDQITSALKSTGESLKEGAYTVLGGEALGKVKNVLSPFLTYRRGSETLNPLASREAQNLIAKYKPLIPSKQLYEKAISEGQTRIPMSKTQEYTEKLLKDASVTSAEAQASKSKVIKWAEGLQEHIHSNAGGLNPYQMNEELKALGKAAGTAEYGPVRGELKQIYRNMVEDLDNASSEYNANKTLQKARDTFKREAVISDIEENIIKWTKGRSGDDAIRFNARKVLDEINKDKFFTQAFNLGEQREIKDLLMKLNKVPILLPVSGIQHGSGPIVRSLTRLGMAAGGAGYGAHYMGLGPESVAIGGIAAGAVATSAYAIQTARFIKQALSMKEGRVLLARLLKEGHGTMTQKAMLTLGQWGLAQDNLKKQVESVPGASLTYQ